MNINDINLIFSFKQSKLGIWIYYFFQFIGVWCNRYVIYNKEQYKKFEAEEIDRCLIVKDDEFICKDIDDKTSHYISSKDNAIDNILRSLLKLFKSDKKENEYLINIYSKYKLNSYLFGYNELYWNIDESLKIKLIHRFKAVLKEIDEHEESKYVAYTKLYLKYIILEMEKEDYSDISDRAKGLLKNCVELLDKHKDWYNLWILAGDICKLSHEDKKFAYKYYEKTLEYNVSEQVESLIELKQNKDINFKSAGILEYKHSFRKAWNIESKGESDVKIISYYNKTLGILNEQRNRGCTEVNEAEVIIKSLTRIGKAMQNMGIHNKNDNLDSEIEYTYSMLEQSDLFNSLYKELGITNEEFVSNIRNGLEQSVEMRVGF